MKMCSSRTICAHGEQSCQTGTVCSPGAQMCLTSKNVAVGYTRDMIRYRLNELVAEMEFREKRRVTQEEIAKATGVHRTTLSKILRQRGYNTTTDNLDALCEFFGCSIEKLVEYVPSSKSTPKKRN